MPQPETDLKTLLEQNGHIETELEAEAEPETETKRKSPVAASRVGKIAMQAHVNKEAHVQLKILSVETGKSIQELLVEGVNAVFTMHNKPPIA